jgi:AcrR family transcriptional regulator
MRTQQIGEAALVLFLAEGVDAVTIDGIVNRAGIAKGSFYRYFDSKSHVVESLFEPLRQSVSSAMNICRMNLRKESTREEVMKAYQELGTTMAAALLRYRDVTLLYLQESRGPRTEVRAPLFGLRRDLREVCVSLARATHEHGITRDVSPEVTAISVLGVAENVFYEYLYNDDFVDSDALAEEVFEVILSGVLSDELQAFNGID